MKPRTGTRCKCAWLSQYKCAAIHTFLICYLGDSIRYGAIIVNVMYLIRAFPFVVASNLLLLLLCEKDSKNFGRRNKRTFQCDFNRLALAAWYVLRCIIAALIYTKCLINLCHSIEIIAISDIMQSIANIQSQILRTTIKSKNHRNF